MQTRDGLLILLQNIYHNVFLCTELCLYLYLGSIIAIGLKQAIAIIN